MSVRLRFVTDTDDVVSAIIRGAGEGFWASHVEAVRPSDGAYVGAHYDGGVQARRPGYDKAWKPEEFFVDVPASDAQTEAFWDFVNAQVGAGYDMSVIRGLAIGVFFGQQSYHHTGKWICSNLITFGLVMPKIMPPMPAGYYTMPKGLFERVTGMVNLESYDPAPMLARVAALDASLLARAGAIAHIVPTR